MTPFLMSGRKGVARRVRPRSEKKRLKKSIEYNDADQATQSSLAGFITVTRFALNLLKVAYAVKSKEEDIKSLMHAPKTDLTNDTLSVGKEIGFRLSGIRNRMHS